MSPKHQLLPGAISEILVSARETGTLTLADRYGLMAATLDERLSEEDQRSVNRLLRSVLKGKIKVTNEFSVIHDAPCPPILPVSAPFNYLQPAYNPTKPSTSMV